MSRGEQTTDLRHMSDAELARKQNSLVHSEKNTFYFIPHTTVKLGIIALKKKKMAVPGGSCSSYILGMFPLHSSGPKCLTLSQYL